MTKFVIGFTAGILAGILFAPDKGSATRQKIVDAGNDLKDKFNDFIDELSTKAEDLAEEADEFATKAKPQYQ